MRCPHCSNPVFFDPEGRILTEEDYKALNSRGTDGGTQEQRLIAALRAGPKTTDDLRRLGIYQPNARVFYARKKGYVINRQDYNGIAVDGYSHAGLARYVLISEPAIEGVAEQQEAIEKRATGGEGVRC